MRENVKLLQLYTEKIIVKFVKSSKSVWSKFIKIVFCGKRQRKRFKIKLEYLTTVQFAYVLFNVVYFKYIKMYFLC